MAAQDGKHLIKFTVTDDEYSKIKQEADAAGVSPNQLCKRKSVRKKRQTQQQSQQKNDLSTILIWHAYTISRIRSFIEPLVVTMLQDKICYRDNIIQLEKMVYEIEKREAKLLNYVRTHGNKRM